jgi:hyperosmotically inducible protein
MHLGVSRSASDGFERSRWEKSMTTSFRALWRAACVAIVTLSLPAWAADPPADAWITTKVKMALLTDDVVDGLDVDVDTFDGRVTLHGQVPSEAAKARADRRAREVAGVTDVRNLLAIVPETARDAVEVADDALARQVEQTLASDPALSGSDVEVKSVNDGIVVLSGEAQTLTAHRRALEDARSVRGVTRVASEIRSPDELGDREIWQEGEPSGGPLSDAALSDAWITTKAKLQLMAEPGLSPLAINVDTDRGVVTLFGIVPTEEIKARAAATVAKLDGVESVENELQVVPDVAAERVEAKDEALRADVEKRLGARDALGDADIQVEVKNRVVRLTGSVATQRDRLTALTIARGTAGVDSVIDDLALRRAGSSS